MYLIDTNIWLEQLLEQDRASEVREFFKRVPSSDLFITDFAFHSICVILTRLKKQTVLLEFVQDVFIDKSVTSVSVLPEETARLMNVVEEHQLDFGDVYQYMAADMHGLVVVSFDKDLEKTPRGKKAPVEFIAEL